MLSAIPNQIMAFLKLSQPSLILRLLFGGCLAFLSQSNLAYAQINPTEVFIAQRRSVYDGVPPAPSNEPLPAVPFGSENYTVPEVNTSSQRSVEFQAPDPPSYGYNRGSALYKVYIDDNGYGRRGTGLIPTNAFRQRFRGRSVIQVGAFRTRERATRLARQLESNGVYSAQVVSSNQVIYNEQNRRNEPDVSYDSGRGDDRRDDYGRGDERRQRSSYYYVVLPANSEELPRYRNDIISYLRRNVYPSSDVYVIPRLEPRGPHLAVGPFVNRWQAEEWNSVLRKDSRFGNARVYYGR
ncbi:SPOR domain-containing protein [Scytonema tolypothrichoides VB-61278]|nr:SPOR domain-containing protein [Scytonema tolypothrichoides VB-61278]